MPPPAPLGQWRREGPVNEESGPRDYRLCRLALAWKAGSPLIMVREVGGGGMRQGVGTKSVDGVKAGGESSRPQQAPTELGVQARSLRGIARGVQAREVQLNLASVAVTMRRADREALETHIAAHPQDLYCLSRLDARGTAYEVEGPLEGISWAMDDGDNGILTARNLVVRQGDSAISQDRAYSLAVEALLASADGEIGAAMFPLKDALAPHATPERSNPSMGLRRMAESLVSGERTARAKYQALEELRRSASQGFRDAQAVLVKSAICELLLERRVEIEAQENAKLVGIRLERDTWDNDDNTVSEYPHAYPIFEDESNGVFVGDVDLTHEESIFRAELEDYAIWLTESLVRGEEVDLMLADPETVIPVRED